MTAYFIDSNAFSKLFLLEQGSISFRQYLLAIGHQNLSVCSIAKLEICSALQQRVFLRELSPVERDHQIAFLEETIDQLAQIDMDTF